jgi:hypothetical protein
MLFDNWKKRAKIFYFLDRRLKHEVRPLIGFSISGLIYEHRPMYLSGRDDGNRWRVLELAVTISRFVIVVHLPFKRLPDRLVKRAEDGTYLGEGEDSERQSIA